MTLVILLMYSLHFLAKILVTTGHPYVNGTHSEVINLNDHLSICEDFTDAQYPMQNGAGGLVNNKILVCGGKNLERRYIDKCFVLRTSKTITMQSERRYPSSFTYNEKVSFKVI